MFRQPPQPALPPPKLAPDSRLVPALVLAAEADKKANRQERGIALYTDYSEVAVPRGETVQMDMSLENKGRTDENIDVRITSVAKGWKAAIPKANL